MGTTTLVLNSEWAEVGGCNPASRQEQWLCADLVLHPAACTPAYSHKPLSTSGGKHGEDPDIQRFGGSEAGLREFVVGTGCKSLRPMGPAVLNGEVRNAQTFGVLKLMLRTNGYDWPSIPVTGKSFADSGSKTYH